MAELKLHYSNKSHALLTKIDKKYCQVFRIFSLALCSLFIGLFIPVLFLLSGSSHPVLSGLSYGAPVFLIPVSVFGLYQTHKIKKNIKAIVLKLNKNAQKGKPIAQIESEYRDNIEKVILLHKDRSIQKIMQTSEQRIAAAQVTPEHRYVADGNTAADKYTTIDLYNATTDLYTKSAEQECDNAENKPKLQSADNKVSIKTKTESRKDTSIAEKLVNSDKPLAHQNGNPQKSQSDKPLAHQNGNPQKSQTEKKEPRAGSVEWYQKSAEQGDIEAQIQLAKMYERGHKVAKNKHEAFKWYTKAAKQGNVDAQFKLGCMYRNGNGVEVNKQNAIYWYGLAASKGHVKAQYYLGYMYDVGEGVTRNKLEAANWYRFADKNGIEAAHLHLGAIDEDKGKCGQDNDKTVKLYQIDVPPGSHNSPIKLGFLYSLWKAGEPDAFILKQEAASQGDVQAQFELGNMYLKGLGIPQNIIKAQQWFEKAAEQGLPAAQFNLGLIYELGSGTSMDLEKAVWWYTKAAEQGDADAQFALSICYGHGKGVQRDKKEAIKWCTRAAEQGNYNASRCLKELGISKPSQSPYSKTKKTRTNR